MQYFSTELFVALMALQRAVPPDKMSIFFIAAHDSSHMNLYVTESLSITILSFSIIRRFHCLRCLSQLNVGV